MNIISFRKAWKDHCDEILASERVFHPNLRTSGEEFERVLRSPQTFGFAVFIEGEYAGNILGYRPTKKEIVEYRMEEYIGRKVLYIFNMVVEPFFQGQGLGISLLKELANKAKEHGYEMLVGHCNDLSLHLMEKLGGRKMKAIENWEGTGQTFYVCELNL